MANVYTGKLRAFGLSGNRNITQYDGEDIPGDLDAWSHFGSDPNSFVTLTYNLLVERSSTLFHTHPPVKSAVHKKTDYVIGKGLKFRSLPDFQTLGIDEQRATAWAQKLESAVNYAFDELNFYNIQSQIFSTMLVNGDSIIYFIPDKNGIIDFKIIPCVGNEVINADASKDNILFNNVTIGIKTNSYGEPVGFYDRENNYHAFDSNTLIYFNKEIAGQLRGYPLAYSIIAACRNNTRYWSSILHRAVLESMILGTETYGDNIGAQMTELAAEQKEMSRGSKIIRRAVETIANIRNIGAGNILKVQAQGNLSFMDMKTPSNNFDKLQNAFIDVVGMATGVPPEILIGKYSTSFTASKGAQNDFLLSVLKERASFIRQVFNPVLHKTITSLILNGHIEPLVPDILSNPLAFHACVSGEILGPTVGHLNPLSEAQAWVLLKNEQLVTPSYAAAQYHDSDYEAMAAQYNREINLIKSPETASSIRQVDVTDEDNFRPENAGFENQTERDRQIGKVN